MRTAVLLALATAVTASAQEKVERPKRGETVVVTGCVMRGRIESQEMKAKDREASYDRLVTFRLTGDKKVLGPLKADHDGHVEIVTAVLRSELPVDAHTRVGNTNIGLGLPGRNDAAMPPSYPVLEVKSAEHTGKTCR